MSGSTYGSDNRSETDAEILGDQGSDTGSIRGLIELARQEGRRQPLVMLGDLDTLEPG